MVLTICVVNLTNKVVECNIYSTTTIVIITITFVDSPFKIDKNKPILTTDFIEIDC